MQHRKTKINPLKRLGLRPGVWFSAGSYKSKLLTPHPKPKPHLLSEGCKPLQGDKQEINLSCCNHNGAQYAVHI